MRDNAGHACCPTLEHFRSLEVADWITTADAEVLSASPHLRNLEKLTLWLGNRDEEAVCRAFASRLRNLREVRLIQFLGGLAAGPEAPALDERADALAELINELRGSPVAGVQRPFAERFPIRRNVRGGIFGGRLSGNRLGVAGVQYHGDWVCLVSFDEKGNYLDEETRQLKGVLKRKPEGKYYSYNKEEVLEYLQEQFGFRLDLVRVGEFSSDGVSVYRYASHVLEVIESPDEIPAEARHEGRAAAVATVRHWVESGDFVIDFGNDCWTHRSGEIYCT